MGTLVFLPWTVVSAGCRVGDFELKPTLVESPSRLRDDRDWLLASPDVSRILRAYRTPPDLPLRAATLVRFAEREFTAELTESDIDRLFTLGESLAFAALSQRRFFDTSHYLNRDSLLLIAQRFVPDEGGVSIQMRRRDGRTNTFVPEQYWFSRKEGHIEPLSNFPLDCGLASAVLAQMNVEETFDRAVRSFNEANTDRSTLSEAQELVSTVSAFQQLFRIRNGSTKETTQAFVDALAPFPSAGTPVPRRQKVHDGVRKGKTLRAIWLDDLGVLRGNVGHGHPASAYPSAWTPQEHLLLAAHVFPLVVKAYLVGRGGPSLSDADRDELCAFDTLLCSENLLATVTDKSGVEYYEWVRARTEGIRDARIARVVQQP